MKVLFVSSGNRFHKILEIVKNQGDSLLSLGIEVDHYLIRDSGIIGYLKNIMPLRNVVRKNNYDLIHAHYLFSAIAASLTFNKPLIVSLMGSDVFKKNMYLILIKVFYKLFWSKCIVKTEQMKVALNIQDVQVLANGVDMKKFRPLDKSFCQGKLGWAAHNKNILFASWPERPEKNYKLAKDAISFMSDNSVKLHYIRDIPNVELVYYYNAADVVLLTSKREGSPNVIKEAIACNRPIVSTDVGDVSRLIDSLENCYITSFKPEDVAQKIKGALEGKACSAGRKRLKELNLDSESVAVRLVKIYDETLERAIHRN